MNRACLYLTSLLLAGCALTPPPHGRPPGALPLEWEQTHVDTVNCRRSDCERWFRADVSGPGKLTVRVRPLPEEGSPPPAFAVALADEELGGLATAASEGLPETQLESALKPGAYLVSIVAAPEAPAFDFAVTLRFRPAPSPPPPPRPSPPRAKQPRREEPPRLEIHRSAVLETEGHGRDLAVLIESGERHGIRVGMRGRLIDGDEQIGTIEIVQVYPDGSRARVEGSLRKAVTHRTVAEIELSAGLPERAPRADDGEPR